MPYQDDRPVSKILWSMVSKAQVILLELTRLVMHCAERIVGSAVANAYTIIDLLSSQGYTTANLHDAPVQVEHGMSQTWPQKTRISGLSANEGSMLIGFSVMTQYQSVTDGQTDG